MVDEDLDSEFEEITLPAKKRSKLKLLFIILILVLIGISALFGLKSFGYVELPPYINIQLEKVERLITKFADMALSNEEEKEPVAPIFPLPEMPLKNEQEKDFTKKRPLQMTGDYFINVGSCLDKRCLDEYSKRFKQLKLLLITRNNIQNTKYYELISESSYVKKRAEEKLRLLNKYNKTNGFPYLVRGKKNHLRISFGQFPQQSNAMRMKSHLEQLYPQIRIRFLIRPKKDRTTVTKLYVGPFNKLTAEQTKIRLQKNPDFDWISITKQL